MYAMEDKGKTLTQRAQWFRRERGVRQDIFGEARQQLGALCAAEGGESGDDLC
jgi:hypothetical protein